MPASREAFGTARMYSRLVPFHPLGRIHSSTILELGFLTQQVAPGRRTPSFCAVPGGDLMVAFAVLKPGDPGGREMQISTW